MPQPAHADVSIARLFQRIVAVIFVLVLAMMVWLFAHQWHAWRDAESAHARFQVFKAGLTAMEAVSAERGPSNALLGTDTPIPAANEQAIDLARQQSDSRLQQLQEALQTSPCDGCQALLDHAKTDLADARNHVDTLTQRPRAERSDAQLLDDVNRMVAIIEPLQSIAGTSAINVIQSDPDNEHFVLAAHLSAILREQAGLLGSRFTPALAANRQLTYAEEFSIARTLGVIDQLRVLMDIQRTVPFQQAFHDLDAQYFDEGLRYVTTTHALAMRPGGAGISTGQFAEQYVPLMRSIVVFRDKALALAGAEIHDDQQRAIHWLVGTGVVICLLACALLWLVREFRERIVRPFTEARETILALAGGDLSTEVPVRDYHGEIKSLFEAMQVLRSNNIDRARLEQERQHLIEELRSMAETDSLTRLFNRRAFESRAREFSMDRNAGEPNVAVIMLDIDHFKRVNDSYGHEAGDLALKAVADIFRSTCRADDIVARIGGEEFAVVMGVQHYAQAVDLAKRLRAKLHQETITVRPGVSFGITASFGIAFAPRASSPRIAALLGRADAMLYRAKIGGRDRIEVET